MARPREVHTTCSFDSSSVSTVAMLSVQEDGGMTSNFSASASPSSASTSTSTSTSCNTDDQNTMTGAASIPTACNSSVDDESSWGRSSASDLTAKTKQAVTTPSTTDSTRSGNFECDLVRLQELERKRLALRHQRFNLEQRLSEFCGKHAEGGSPITPTGRPCQNVLDFQWKDTSTGLKVVYTGQLNEFGQPHGSQGRLQFADGQVYMGDVRNGYRAGQGRNSWPDGQDYVGEWKKNSRNGRGTHVWPDGRKVSGLWLDGHLNGKVYFSWPNGATYDGMVRKGKKHGRGVHTWADGRVYSGSFDNGKEHGFGTLSHPDGVKYRGQFDNGVKHGYGIMLWKTRTYDGEWVQNKPEGQGRVVWSNGAIYTGQFKEGKYHGLGVYAWPSGKKFVGRWENGVKNGHGLYSWPNGKKYDGEYKNGIKHGYGRMTWADGQTYCGGFEENQRSGRGIQATSSGEIVHCGMWKNDMPVGESEDVFPLEDCPVPSSVAFGAEECNVLQTMSPLEQERDICSPKMVARIDDEDDDDCRRNDYSFYSPLARNCSSVAA